MSDPTNPLCDTIDLLTTDENVVIQFTILQGIKGGGVITEQVTLTIPCGDNNIVTPSITEPEFLEKIVNDKGGRDFYFRNFSCTFESCCKNI